MKSITSVRDIPKADAKPAVDVAIKAFIVQVLIFINKTRYQILDSTVGDLHGNHENQCPNQSLFKNSLIPWITK